MTPNSAPLPDPDRRLAKARDWLGQSQAALKAAGWALDLDGLSPASADASFRRYFRLPGHQGGEPGSLILMDAPPTQEAIAPFIKTTGILKAAGLHVPEILAQNLADGFLLISDLGQQTYLTALTEVSAPGLYQEAWQALIRLQRADPHQSGLPVYDQEMLLREMRLFDEWFLKRHLQIVLTDAAQAQLTNVYQQICSACLAQPKVIVHRDYHSRNLMVLAHNGPGVLDYQDAVIGPISYDLVSLLRDAYIAWPEPAQLDWAIRYWQDAKTGGLPIAQDFADFWRDFEWMGLQRQLKVLGIFARLFYRDGKENYLKDLPVVLNYARQAAERYVSLQPLAKLLQQLPEDIVSSTRAHAV